jgi:HPt (histidine-containing phosphotransfer) domain-containing protein
MSPESDKQLVFDLTQNSASLHIGEDIYLRILGKAVTQTQNDISDLEKAIMGGDFEKIRAIAHRLKGDYDNMRISSLSTIAKEINEIAKTSQDKDRLSALVLDFNKLFEQLKEKINNPKT